MAGRKRKLRSAALEHEDSASSSSSSKRPPAALRGVVQGDEEDPGGDAERSRYFTGTDPARLRLGEAFFDQPCISLAKALLGKVLARRCADGSELRGRIVETEAYLGGEDGASHSAGGKRTERNAAMFMKPGTIYVYPIYGIYLCMNVSSQGEGAAVLLRSLEPLQGQPLMRRLRAARRREGAPPLKDRDLCNGPSKLCQALDVPRGFDRRDLASDPEVWLEGEAGGGGVPTTTDPLDVVSAPRVGIESHGEWARKPWRFYLRGHPCVSVVNREAEGARRPSGNVVKDSEPSHVQSDGGPQSVPTTATTLPAVPLCGNSL